MDDQAMQQATPEQTFRSQHREECINRYFIDVVQYHKAALDITKEMNPSEIAIICAYFMAFLEHARAGILTDVFLNAFNRFRRGVPIMIQQFIEENGPLADGMCPIVVPNFLGFNGDRPNIKCYLGEPETIVKQ